MTTPHAQRWSGAPHAASPKPTTGTGRTSEGKFLMTAPLFLPSKGSEHNRGAARVGSEEYCRPHKKRRSCRAEVAKSGQDCLTLCAAAWD